MAVSSVLCLLVVMLVSNVQDTTSCSCQPSHPQEDFCRAAYVIRARVTSKELIYPEPQPQPMTESSSFSEVSFSDSDWGIDTNEAPQNSIMPIGEGLLEAPLHLAALPREPETLKIPVGLQAQAHNYAEENHPIKLEYTVKVEKIYKGDELLMPKSQAKIATAAISAACGVTDLQIDQVYLLAGSFYNAELRLSSCNWVQGYKNITKRQRQGIRHTYKLQCGKCDISPCYGRYCPRDLVPDMCMWDLAHLRDNCETHYAFCARNAQDECVWSGKVDFKRCLRRRIKNKKRSRKLMP